MQRGLVMILGFSSCCLKKYIKKKIYFSAEMESTVLWSKPDNNWVSKEKERKREVDWVSKKKERKRVREIIWILFKILKIHPHLTVLLSKSYPCVFLDPCIWVGKIANIFMHISA